MTYIFIVNALTHCATLLSSDFGQKYYMYKNLYLILSFILIGSWSQYEGVPNHFNKVVNS